MTYLYGGGTAVCALMHIIYFLLLSFNFSVEGLCDQAREGVKLTDLISHFRKQHFNGIIIGG